LVFNIKKVQNYLLYSTFLNRKVRIELLHTGHPKQESCSGILLLNDGQLAETLDIQKILDDLYSRHAITSLKVVAIHAGERHMEYGVTGTPDYLGRGMKAGNYEAFIINELLPWLHKNDNISKKSQTAFAGFSLGGLSAFDIAISNPGSFSGAGIFSGSLWWRQKSYDDGYTDSDRIIFNKVAHTTVHHNFKCYLMAGTNDERNDRNENGIIDSVDDTLDMFDLLSAKINHPASNIRLSIIEGGRHEPVTWSQQMPEFLIHTFGKPIPSLLQ